MVGKVLMRTPIVVYENGDVSVFSSRETAERALEPIDIKNGEYKIFDASGTLITPRVVKQKRGSYWIEAVELSDVNDRRMFEDELQSLLTDFLVRANLKSENEISSLDLSSTLKIFIEEVGYTE